MANDLTGIITRRFQRLQHVVADAPQAGEISEIRGYLDRVVKSAHNFQDLLDDLEHWRGPDALAGDDNTNTQVR